MVVRFPHILRYTKDQPATEPVQDANGDWISAPSPSDIKEIICRVTPNGDGSETKGENGDKVVYDFLIYAEAGQTDLVSSMQVELFDRGSLIGKGIIQRIHGSSKNTRIWV